MPKTRPHLACTYKVFGLSQNHELSTLLVNIENTKRFADLLHVMERDFFTSADEFALVDLDLAHESMLDNTEAFD